MNASCGSRASHSVCFRVIETAPGTSVTYGIVGCRVYFPSKSPLGSVYATFRNIKKNRILSHSVFVFMIRRSSTGYFSKHCLRSCLFNQHARTVCSLGSENWTFCMYCRRRLAHKASVLVTLIDTVTRAADGVQRWISTDSRMTSHRNWYIRRTICIDQINPCNFYFKHLEIRRFLFPLLSEDCSSWLR